MNLKKKNESVKKNRKKKKTAPGPLINLQNMSWNYF